MTLQRKLLLFWVAGSIVWLASTYCVAFFTMNGLTRDMLVIMGAPPLVLFILGPALAWSFRLRERL